MVAGMQLGHPRLHVEGDDGGGAVMHLADHGRELIGSAVMQHPAQQR